MCLHIGGGVSAYFYNSADIVYLWNCQVPAYMHTVCKFYMGTYMCTHNFYIVHNVLPSGYEVRYTAVLG